MAYFITYLDHHFKMIIVYTVMFVVMIVSSFVGLVVAFLTIGDKTQLFSAPLLECGCNKQCMVLWSWIMTVVGFFITLSFIVYLLYAIPTIVFVYYLYPTCTLIRVPFIIGALFYTIALTSLVLYLFEKFCTVILCNACFFCHTIKDHDYKYRPLAGTVHNYYGATSGTSIQNNEHEMITASPRPENANTSCICTHLCTKQGFNGTIRQHIHNKAHYKNKLEEDMKVITGRCHFVYLISFFQLFAGTIILVTFICAEFVLAKLVFKETNVTGINSLLVLLPTLIFSAFTWFGRGLIFDVKEDLRN